MSAVLLFHTSFQNRGDALMAEAVLERLGPSHDWSVAADVAFYARREARGLRTSPVSMLTGVTAKQRAFNRIVSFADKSMQFLPSFARRGLSVVPLREIDVALDLSGYSFGDPWGEERVRRAIRVYRQLRDSGSKVILMPRMWGPFERFNEGALDAMFAHVDLAFARDNRSLANVQQLLGPLHRAKISFAPDYTHAVKPDLERWPVEPGLAMLVPSSRVIDSGTMSLEAYIDLFAASRVQLAEAGLRPTLMIHETSNDLRFLNHAAAMGFSQDEVLVPENAIAAKSMIAQASAVVTSRLHALYSALNSAVPVAVVAWNFKYAEALAQYDCADCLVDPRDHSGSLRLILARITSEPGKSALQRAMRQGKGRAEKQTETMWERIGEATGLDLG